MNEFLELCGFEPEEIKKETPRIRRAFDKLQINNRDIDAAKERLNKYFEIDLKAVRMVLKIYIREVVRLVLAGEEYEKVLYIALPTLLGDLMAVATSANKNVYGGFSDLMMLMVYGGIFRKMEPVFEAAEQCCLGPESAHCGCQQAKLGMQLLNLIPKPDLVISGGMYCDEASKVDDFMHNYLDIPVVYLNRVQDANWDEAITERDIQYFAAQMRKGTAKMGEIIGREITDEMLWQCLSENMAFMQTNLGILDLMINSDPVPLSANTMLWAFVLYVANVGIESRSLKLEMFKTLLEEAQQRVDRGEGFYEKGAPRITISSFLPIAEPAFDYLLRDVGLSVPIFEGQWWIPDAELAPELPADELDPYRIMANVFLRITLAAPSSKRLSAAAKASKKYDLDGFLILPHYSCRPIMGDALMLKDAVKREMNLPATVMESDIYDYRHYTVEQQRTRIESFAEICKIAKMKKQKAKAA